MNCSLTSPRAKRSRTESVLTIFVSQNNSHNSNNYKHNNNKHNSNMYNNNIYNYKDVHTPVEVEEEEVEEGRPKRRELHNI